MGEIDRDLGRMESDIETLKIGLADVQKDIKSILSTLSEARGGWKTLMLVGGIAGAVGALLGKLISITGYLPK